MEQAIQQTKAKMEIGGRRFDLAHTHIMGILNLTPDSFSDGGSYRTLEDALRQTESMLETGAEIIDVGGESTRPGYVPVDAEEEARRVLPVIEAIRRRFEAPISIDTQKASVADAALERGANMVNDIWGLRGDAQMARVIARSGAACCLMHNRREPVYGNLLGDCMAELAESVALAEKAGIAREKILLDPGIGFGKTPEQNLYILKHLAEFRSLGYPMLLGASRKSVIGRALDLPPGERVEGTLVTTVFAVLAGWSFVRVHDVKENARAVRMAEAIRDSAI